MSATPQTDETQYECPECGYDGSSYEDGKEGWVDHAMPGGDACARCCEQADAFKCERCKRWLAGEHYSAPDCNETGFGVALCGVCAGHVGGIA